MINFTNIPANMDKQLYIKTLSKEYKTPLDILWKLIKEMNNENDFFNILNWNKEKNAYGFKK